MARLNESGAANDDNLNNRNPRKSTSTTTHKSIQQQRTTNAVVKNVKGRGRGRPPKPLSSIGTTAMDTIANAKKHKDIENSPPPPPMSLHTRSHTGTHDGQSQQQLLSSMNTYRKNIEGLKNIDDDSIKPSPSRTRVRTSRTSHQAPQLNMSPSTPSRRDTQQPSLNFTPDSTSTSTSAFPSHTSFSLASSSFAFTNANNNGSPISRVRSVSLGSQKLITSKPDDSRTTLEISIKELKKTCSSQDSNSITSQWARLQALHQDSQDLPNSLAFAIYIFHHTTLNLSEVRFAVETCERSSWEEVKRKKFKHASRLVHGLVEFFNLEGWWQVYLWFGRGTVESRITLQAIKAFAKALQRKRVTIEEKGGRSKKWKGNGPDIEMFHGWLHEARMQRDRGNKVSRDLSKFIVADVKKAWTEICPWTKNDDDSKGSGGGGRYTDIEEELPNGEGGSDTGEEEELRSGDEDEDIGDEEKSPHRETGNIEGGEDEDGWHDVVDDENVTSASSDVSINISPNQHISDQTSNDISDESSQPESESMDLTNVVESTIAIQAGAAELRAEPTNPIETENPSLNSSTIEVEVPRKVQLEMSDTFEDSLSPTIEFNDYAYEEGVDESFIFQAPNQFTTAEEEMMKEEDVNCVLHKHGQMDTTALSYDDSNSIDVRHATIIDLCSNDSNNEAKNSRFKYSHDRHSNLDSSNATKVLQSLRKPCEWTDEVLNSVLGSFSCPHDIRILHPLAFPFQGINMHLFSLRKYFDYKIILVPLHHPGKAAHWSLVVVEPKKSFFKHYDSIPSDSRWKLVKDVMSTWLKRQNEKCEWRLAKPLGKCMVGSKQKDSVSCGLFVAGWCWNILSNNDGDINENNVGVFDEHEFRKFLLGRFESRLKNIGDVEVNDETTVIQQSNFAGQLTNDEMKKVLAWNQNQQVPVEQKLGESLKLRTHDNDWGQVERDNGCNSSSLSSISAHSSKRYEGEEGLRSLEISPITSCNDEVEAGDKQGYGERKGVGVVVEMSLKSKGKEVEGEAKGMELDKMARMNEVQCEKAHHEANKGIKIMGFGNFEEGGGYADTKRMETAASLEQVGGRATKGEEHDDEIVNFDCLSTGLEPRSDEDEDANDATDPIFKDIIECRINMKRKYKEFTKQKQKMEVMIQKKRVKLEEDNERVHKELKKLEEERKRGEERVRWLSKLNG
ncbi:hypothetical protein ACHAO1_011234 [Botrytis cinerea]